MFRTVGNLIRRRLDHRWYGRLIASAERREFPVSQLRTEGYYSQSGQDKWVIETLFPGKRDGIFVDIGAHDGITLSNTYALERMGWRGLAVEPIPAVYERLVANRRCATVHGCIAPRSGSGLFRVVTGYPEMLSGLVDGYDPRHLQRIESELTTHGGNCSDIEVECFNLNEVLEDHGISHVDYLSIDVEGAEHGIVESIDFSRVSVRVLGVENNYRESRTPRLLMQRGYALHSVVGDEFFLSMKASVPDH